MTYCKLFVLCFETLSIISSSHFLLVYSNQRFYVCDLHLCGDAGLFVVVVR